MRVFVTGASGAIGSRIVPRLVAAGHEVVGAHHSPASAERVRAAGATPVMLDLLDARAVRKAVLESRAEAIVHEATALANVKFSRNQDRVAAGTNALRTRGTDALLAAAGEAGVRRFVAQSVAAFGRYAREGGPVKTEDDPVDATPPRHTELSSAALAHLEQAVTGFGGIALRYGVFYGSASDGTIAPVRKRQFPIVGDGGGIWSWIHLDDAAAATVLALEHQGPAIYERRRRRPRPGAGMAAGAGADPGRTAAAAPARVARPAARRRLRGGALDRGARRLEREGQARARLGAEPSQLARGLPGGLRGDRQRRPAEAARGDADGPVRRLGPASPSGRRPWSRPSGACRSCGRG